MSAVVPGVVLALLAEMETVWNKHIDAHADTDLKHWFPLGLSVESHGEHIATLYEEGWDFDAPKKVTR